jgi:CubicO group peptidase (beta-lactamase class C family)
MKLRQVALATLLGVGMSQQALAQRTDPAAPAPRVDEVQGMSRERLARIAPVMKQQVEKGMFPGAVTLIARRGQIVHFEAHGFLDSAKTKPMTKDAIFRLASMTKPIVTVAAMMMVEQGALKLNDPIATWLPELKELKVETKKTDKDGTVTTEDVPASPPITVQDLMRHTSGFFYSAAVGSPRLKEAYEKANIEARETDITGDEMLKRLGRIPLAYQPGTTFNYSISTDVLGLLLERVAKVPLDRLLKEILFDPLGCKDTAFWVPPERVARLADAYDSDPLRAAYVKASRILENPAGKSYFKGGGGLVATAEDYFKFAEMMLNGGERKGRRYLSRKTVEFMLSDHIVGLSGSPMGTTGPGYGFGLGFGVRLHEGLAWVPGSKGDAMWAGLWGTSFTIDPKESLVAILMAQGPSNRTHTRMLFKNLVYGALVQ